MACARFRPQIRRRQSARSSGARTGAPASPRSRPARKSRPRSACSTTLGPAPYLVVKVNGVRIVCRGGNWGMDDARKRVSREHLEPYFRLRSRRPSRTSSATGWDRAPKRPSTISPTSTACWSGTTSGSRRRTTTSKPQDPQLFLEECSASRSRATAIIPPF